MLKVQDIYVEYSVFKTDVIPLFPYVIDACASASTF